MNILNGLASSTSMSTSTFTVALCLYLVLYAICLGMTVFYLFMTLKFIRHLMSLTGSTPDDGKEKSKSHTYTYLDVLHIEVFEKHLNRWNLINGLAFVLFMAISIIYTAVYDKSFMLMAFGSEVNGVGHIMGLDLVLGLTVCSPILIHYLYKHSSLKRRLDEMVFYRKNPRI